MGRFFSNIQIKNNQENREQFIAELNNAMKKRELIPATEDDASLTYILAFSKNNQWATLCSADYESGGEDVKKDVQFLAESLKNCCISTSVVDSDFTILEMYNGTSTLTDMVVVGDGEDYGFEDDTAFQGKKEHWQPLLGENVTWEQLSEIWNGDYIFTEDALSEMAPLIGMDSENIISDYDDLSGKADKNIVELHFKRADKKKAMSLNTAFKQVFGEYLEPLGFKKIKGRHPYFVRVVEGGEIIHVITIQKIDDYTFDIEAGVATVYRPKIDLSVSPRFNADWLMDNCTIYTKSHPIDLDMDYRKSIMCFGFSFGQITDEVMFKTFRHSLEVTKQWIMPVLDKINSIDNVLEYLYFYTLPQEFYYRKDTFERNWNSEGLLKIRFSNADEYFERNERYMKKDLDISDYQFEKNKNLFKPEDYEWKCQAHQANIKAFYEDKAIRKKMVDERFNDTDWCNEVFTELERRKVANTETLRSYGLNL